MINIQWAAGLFDGEGCIGIYKSRSWKGVSTYSLWITVTNTEYELLKPFLVFGGKIRKVKIKTKINWKPRYDWRLFSKKAEKAIILLQPFLKSPHKIKAANLALQFQKQKLASYKFLHMKKENRLKYNKKQYSFVIKMRKINQRGTTLKK